MTYANEIARGMLTNRLRTGALTIISMCFLLTARVYGGASGGMGSGTGGAAGGVNGLHLVGHYDNKHGSTSGVAYSGSWGYVAPDGREYAILGTATGTAIIDITDTSNIHEIEHVTGPTSIWREMRTYKDRLYIVSEGGNGTTIVDLSLLPKGVGVVKNFVYTSGTRNTVRSHTIEIFDGYMYLNGCANWGLSAHQGSVIFSLADPDNPQYVGEYSPNYFHDCYVRHDTIFGASVYAGGGIYIADIRDKSAPIPIGKISYPGSGTHNLWTTTNGSYLISTDEIGGTPKTLKFWDMQNLPTLPLSPSATYQFSPLDIEHNVTVRGNYAYTAWYTAGTVVADIHDPTNPITAGFYDSSVDSLYPPGNYDGVWAVYPYYWSGKITAGDMQNGLYVFTFDSLRARTPVSLLAPATQSVFHDESPITFRWTRAGDPVADPHTYRVGLRGPGVDTLLSAGTDTTLTLQDSSMLQNGSYTWWVNTADEIHTIATIDTFAYMRTTASLGVRNDGDGPEQPMKFTLYQNYPNPFNPSTLIRFDLPEPALVSMKIYDVLDREVATLLDRQRENAGQHQLEFRAGQFSSGIYFCRITAESSRGELHSGSIQRYSALKKLLIVK